MNNIERLGQCVSQLVNGWHDRIEYKVNVDGNIEARAKTVRHTALLVQLHEAAQHNGSMGNSGGSNPNKAGSRPPGNTAPLNLIDAITEESQYHYHNLCTVVNGKAPTLMRRRPVTQTLHNLVAVALVAHEYPISVNDVTQAAQLWVRKSRVLLGYDKPQALLRDTVCGTCGGALVVATDASTDVRCIGTPTDSSCGQVYPRHTWLDLLNGE